MNVHDAVRARYSGAAREREAELCCPVSYDPQLLKLLPQEILDKDYGCGDPSRYVRAGDTVLDLGSGSGKICYIAAQLVGPGGRVIGVDINDDMLALARKYQAEMAHKLGEDRVRFVKGHIQNLALDPESGADAGGSRPPLIADASVDVVISNCVLNLVAETDRRRLIAEIFRVLKPGGRAAISDIVSDEPVPEALKQDAQLWSGCLSGAFQEAAFLASFRDAGFLAVAYDKWETRPWRVVEGIEFRSVTLTAVKGAGTPCLDVGHAVIYRGPFASVTDDEGHVYFRGERMAVCERTYRLLTEQPPYRDHFVGIAPAVARTPVAWCAPSGTRRPASESKGGEHKSACGGENGCC
jgi:ubiquinone/menaquinone biosynthesis C-methylase UbiE